MKRLERSRSRSHSGIRKHSRKNYVLDNLIESSSESRGNTETIENIEHNEEFEKSNETNKRIPKERKKYSLSSKKKYVQKYYEEKENNPKLGTRKIANALGVPYSCLREWVQQYKYIESTTNKKDKFRLEGGGRLPETLTIEEELIRWVCEQRRCEIPITTKEIILKSMELDPNQKNKSETALEHWVLGFLRRYSYSIRAGTHIGQKLKASSMQDYKEFMLLIYYKRKKYGEDFDASNIFNMDETPIYLESISKKTVALIGQKSINIRSNGGEKTRITVILLISASGEKLPPLLIFKGEKDGRKEKALNNNEYCRKKKYLLFAKKILGQTKKYFQNGLNNVFYII